MNAQIERAIEFSIHRNFVGKASVETSGDIFDVLRGVDYDDMEEEYDGSYDVWGNMDENGEGDRSWRINIKLVKA
jgi:hypothetical protein